MEQLNIKAIPNAGKTEIVGMFNGALKIKVNAQPEKGKANKEIINFLAKKLGIKKKDIEIVKGLTSREKVVHIEGVSANDLNESLSL